MWSYHCHLYCCSSSSGNGNFSGPVTASADLSSTSSIGHHLDEGSLAIHLFFTIMACVNLIRRWVNIFVCSKKLAKGRAFYVQDATEMYINGWLLMLIDLLLFNSSNVDHWNMILLDLLLFGSASIFLLDLVRNSNILVGFRLWYLGLQLFVFELQGSLLSKSRV